MLIENTEGPSGGIKTSTVLPRRRRRMERMLRPDWLGQTLASLCWIGSVLTYGISSTGDWLQILAASAWLFANISTVVFDEAD